MNKSQLITRLSGQYKHLKPKDIKDSVNTILEAMTSALEHGNRVEIRGFGSYHLKHQKARKSRNPKTGKDILTKEKFMPRFKPAKQLRERANNQKHEVS